MLKSLEDYLTSLSFEPPEPKSTEITLNAGERSFVEKYLGLDALPQLPEIHPEPVPLPEPALAPLKQESAIPLPQLVIARQAPQLIVSERIAQKTPTIEIAPAKEHLKEIADVETPYKEAEKIEAKLKEPLKTEAIPKTELKTEVPQAAPVKSATISAKAAITAKIEPVKTKTAPQAAPVVKADTKITATPVIKSEPAIAAAPVISEEPVSLKEAAIKADTAFREKMRQLAEVQAVSFFVAGQIFLLPVAGIQEVLRHTELVKVPQAPSFIAGALNLRGVVMPVVHLSALLTNSPDRIYNERSFIIITGNATMQMGLIIDKVSGMHMVPQKKIIWNVESKLGDAAEFLGAIVDLDDKVCGMIAPDLITQKILTEF